MIIDTALSSLLITIMVMLISGAIGYGVLIDRVRHHGEAIKELQNSYKIIDAKLDDICEKVSGIQATLKEKDREKQ